MVVFRVLTALLASSWVCPGSVICPGLQYPVLNPVHLLRVAVHAVMRVISRNASLYTKWVFMGGMRERVPPVQCIP